MAIEVLPDHVVAQIAAGEVVERPASVVKELLENAIDAGASSIHVSVTGGGQRLIRISDNGSGMRADEVELAFARHATSKLRSADDLQRIATLGFRGEALFSIASVSRVTLTTRHHDEAAGTKLHIEGSVLLSRQSVGAPAGTVIAVENLFFNTPARLKFLKKDTTERRQITTLVTHYAMAYPHIRFVLEHDGREVFRSSGSGQLADVLIKALGLEVFRQMLPVDATGHGIRALGFTAQPSLYRADRGRITLFVNGRSVQDNGLIYAVTQAYQGFLEAGQYPLAVLMVTVPSQDVDVNVHPTKAEVRFRDQSAVFSVVQRAVREALLDEGERAPGGFSPVRAEAVSQRWGQQMAIDFPDDLPDTPAATASSGRTPPHSTPLDPTAIPYGPGAPLKPRTLPVLRVVGQVGASYIVAEGPSGLYLIDQYAAHQRVLYDQLSDRRSSGEAPGRPLDEALTVELPPARAKALDAHLDALASAGFGLEPFGPHTFLLRAAPVLLAGDEAAQAVSALAADLHQKRPAADQVADFVLTQVCKRAAVKVGQVLSLEEMQNLVRQLERCQTPLASPEGRPTMLHMSGDQLAREFGR